MLKIYTFRISFCFEKNAFDILYNKLFLLHAIKNNEYTLSKNHRAIY